MRESDFVEQNKSNWGDFEKEWTKPDPRPEKIAKHYVDIVDDLSYARTHYPNRIVRSYLNGVTENLSIKIQRSRKQFWKNAKKFWQKDLPLIMYESRWQFLLAFVIFSLAVAIGVLSSIHDKEFAASILGPDYIAQTLENIKNDDPMAIYKSSDAAPMFFRITFNNTFIAVKTFVLSLFLGFGTIIILMYNGVMLGVFQYFFIERGLFFESFLTIWQHGVVEISCIILAGASGLVLAKGILFPGTYSRLDSFRLAGRKGLIMMMGILPLLVYSGIIESWVTRYTDVHWIFRLSTIVLSVSFVLIYFVFYPRRVAKQHKLEEVLRVVKIPLVVSEFSTETIQKNGIIFWEAIRIALNKTGIIFLTFSILAVILYYFSVQSGKIGEFIGPYWFIIEKSNSLTQTIVFSCTLFPLLLVQFFAAKGWLFYRFGSSTRSIVVRNISVTLTIATLTSLLFSNGWLVLLWVFCVPFLGLLYTTSLHPKHDESSLLSTTSKLAQKSYFKFLGLVLISLCAYFILSTLITSILEMIIIQLFGGLVLGAEFNIGLLWSKLQIILSVLLWSGFIFLLYLSYVLSYFSITEMVTARHLKSRIRSVFAINEKVNEQKIGLLRKEKFQS